MVTESVLHKDLKEFINPEAYVLVVDDSQASRSLLSAMLRELGLYNVIHETNGLRALEVLQKKEHPFELVFSDWRMSGLTGLGLLVRIRADKDLKKLSFVMVTDSQESENVQFAIKAGVSAYLLKPFTVSDLKEKIILSMQDKKEPT